MQPMQRILVRCYKYRWRAKNGGEEAVLRPTGQSEMPASALPCTNLTAVKKIQVDI